MCSCGERLPDIQTEAVCPACGRRYFIESTSCREILESEKVSAAATD
jgi:predicted RNA-binding Zn-ribbon protein involved in translation (DUF1610 family)